MAEIKLIASDYDGTLNRHGISERVRNAIEAWRAAGNLFGIVSGRGIYNIAAVLANDGLDCDFLIGNNGAVVGNGKGEVLLYTTEKAPLGREIAAFVMARGGRQASVNYFGGEYLVVDGARKARHADDERYKTLDHYEERDFTQISTYCDSIVEATLLCDLINETFGERVTALLNGVCIDIVPKGIDKAEGIRRLCGLWEISENAVCTVGDNYNDVAMLKAFRSYAVSNAVDYVKQIASAVVEDIAELCEKENAQ